MLNKKSFSVKNVFIYIFLVIGAFISIMPFLWLVTTSLKPPGKIFSAPLLIPTHFYYKNYIEAWNSVPFARYIINSTIMSLGIVICQTLFSAMAGYAFAKIKFKFKDALFLIFLITMMIPDSVKMIPNFLTIKNLGWYDTYAALIVPRAASVFAIFLFRQFFLSIPSSIEESARLEGCGLFRLFFQIVLPLSKPVLVTNILFSFLFAWNDFLWPLIITDSQKMRTIQVGLSYFQGRYGVRWELLSAATIFAILPSFIVFIIAQKYFIEGISTSGLKE
ncbi:MAG: carbohydrate ABC transporter permease [Defluviitoga tunisiensis]|jgi:multiple sugar transport system permease protein|uniref:ABC-type sugar transport protein, permease component n=1 Tax=Defluviitoga tunisiensis TaxID=1006576 RepID=A0A0C7P3I6_DEFTU|nr:carbohydrate ABC transporter permease [Defluviitoga tunisiensis]MDD3600744.1 carbohydrate ABC transporter permease [Defluviitoga tunisiensis]MDY0379007.1 carbohydrate ABC transporter permease [Defluviitoga tunisiensis]CEP78865.1 ABC-type sugar transport protein, permease component [Defluviitoga tunisiensis]HHV01526.1 carbohydrate ABC transporter permease [Defluviitoga tunisiensis]HOB55424.1 carbohydrate ABC transporter permease [Defluviitoga tunisiensis]